MPEHGDHGAAGFWCRYRGRRTEYERREREIAENNGRVSRENRSEEVVGPPHAASSWRCKLDVDTLSRARPPTQRSEGNVIVFGLRLHLRPWIRRGLPVQ